jgi:hypothetical protein
MLSWRDKYFPVICQKNEVGGLRVSFEPGHCIKAVQNGMQPNLYSAKKPFIG